MIYAWLVSIGVFAINLMVMLKVMNLESTTKTQKWFQVLLILLLPVLGALLALLAVRIHESARSDAGGASSS